MTIFDPGDVVLVRFPFTNLAGVKKRPALVINPVEFSRRFGDVVLIALTSQPQSEAVHLVHDWREAGLPKPTWFKPIIATLSASMIERRLGRLTALDLSRVPTLLRTLITPEFTPKPTEL